MMYVTPFGLVNIEGFQGTPAQPTVVTTSGSTVKATTTPTTTAANAAASPPQPAVNTAVSQPAPTGMTQLMMPSSQPAPTTGSAQFMNGPRSATEGFATYSLATGGGTGDNYQPMGAFDNIRLSTGNDVSKWRYTAPNEPLNGPEFKPGPDDLFMFKNNQCKPECCGASFSCDGGGCVCTTPQQRDFINQRGGNRTAPDDGV
jgi:hypothetical protein